MSAAGRVAALLFLLLLSIAGAVRAEQPASDLTLSAEGGLPLELARTGAVISGKLRLENRGSTPAELSVFPRGVGEPLPRLPATVDARFSEGTHTRIEPGQAKEIVVRWSTSQTPWARELYGHIVVQASSGQTLAAGFHGRNAPEVLPFERRALSLLLLLPLVGLLVLAAARFAGDRATKHLWKVAASVSALQLVLAVGIHARFDVAASRYDGNEGFQFVERQVLLRGLGVEYALGVDGLSLGLVVLSAFALLAVAVLGSRTKANAERHWALLLLANLGAVGALIALDLALLLAFWGLALVASTLIVGGSADGSRRSAKRFAVLCLVAYALVFAACVLVATFAGPALLVDGTRVPRAFSIAEIVHVDLVGTRHTIGSLPAIKLIYAALLLGLGTLMGLAPLNAWLAGTIARVPATTALLLAVTASGVASYLMLRIGYAVVPAGTAWAAPLLSGLGALSVIWGALTSAVQDDLKRLSASATAVNAGIGLFAIGSLTAIGVEGAVAAIQSQLLSSVIVLGLGAQLEARFASCDLGRVRSLGVAAPAAALIACVAGLSLLGAPGSYTFVSRLLSIVGALPLRPLAAVGVIVGLLILAVSQARLLRSVLAGRPEDTERATDAASTERVLLVLAALAVVVLGFWPKLALWAVSASSLDHAARVNPPGPLEIVDDQENRPGPVLARALPRLRSTLPPLSRLSDPTARPLFAACVQAKP